MAEVGNMRTDRRWLQYLGRLTVTIAAITFLHTVIIWWPHWKAANVEGTVTTIARAELEDSFRRTAIQFIGGLLILLTAYVGWRRVRAAERQVDALSEGQVTDRFTRAVEQLGASDEEGDPKLEIRLGAIYALERIARDSSKDHWVVMELLCAYLRQNSSVPIEDLEEFETPGLPARIDIQAAATVIGRRNTLFDPRLGEGLDLERLILEYGELSNADFSYALFFEAVLESATLRNSRFVRSRMQFSHLGGCFAEGADFRSANLQNAFFHGATVEGACFVGANMRRAYLSNAKAAEADFQDADLQGADLKGTDLSESLNLTFEQVAQAIVYTNTKLPQHIESRRPELTERSVETR